MRRKEPSLMLWLGARGRAVPVAVLLLSVACLAAPVRAAGTLDPASIKETVFPNGLRLLIKEAQIGRASCRERV